MGPLDGFTVIELAGIGPAPYAGMLLADLGADVIRIEKAATPDPRRRHDVSLRNKRSIILDLKTDQGRGNLLGLVERADALIEGLRPGVAERLGVGPNVCRERNAMLVYGRVTGWGQDGPLALAAGHDINYIALSGALHAVGTADAPPVPPANFVGDMGGGGLLLAFGVVCALLEAQRSGEGQVVDAAMIDGAASQTWMLHQLAASGFWDTEHRGANLLDGGAHFYATYETADGRYISVGCIESKFYAEFLDRVGVDKTHFAGQLNPARWAELKQELARVFRKRTRDEWCELLEGTDACVAPVLTIKEAPEHSHHAARGTFVEVDGMVQPGPVPRFSRTPGHVSHAARPPGADTGAVLEDMKGAKWRRKDG